MRTGKSISRTCIFFSVLLTAALWAGAANAQMTARGLGLGGAYTALARGVHAQYWNPANLGLPDNSRFSFTFVSTEAGVWNNSFSKGTYEKYNGKYLTADDIQDILNKIPEQGFDMTAGTHVQALSFSIGRFALSLGARAGTRLQLNKSFFGLLFEGISENQYRFDNNMADALGIGTAAISWGQPIPVTFADALAVGVTLSMYYAGAYAHADRADFAMDMHKFSFDLNGDYEMILAYPDSGGGGVGWGMDFGIAGQFRKNWTVGLSLSNVHTSIPWSDLGKREIGFIRGDSLVVLDFEDNIVDSSWTVLTERFKTRLPFTIRLGASYETRLVMLSMDYTQAFENTPWSSKRPGIGIGAEFRMVPWLPLRVGTAFGGRIGWGTSFGFGLRPGGFVFDVAVMNSGFLTPASSKGLVIAFEIGLDLAPKPLASLP